MTLGNTIAMIVSENISIFLVRATIFGVFLAKVDAFGHYGNILCSNDSKKVRSLFYIFIKNFCAMWVLKLLIENLLVLFKISCVKAHFLIF